MMITVLVYLSTIISADLNDAASDTECMSSIRDEYEWYGVTVEQFGAKNKKCIFISHHARTRVEAEAKCRTIRGDLLTIHHLDEHNQIFRILQSSQFDSDNYWIGLVSDMWWDRDTLQNIFKWFWIDLSELSFHRWAKDQREQESAMRAYVSRKNGEWYYSNPSEKFSFICERWLFGTPTPPPETNIDGGCADGWFPYKNQCFLFTKEQQSWATAEETCKARNGHLATIDDPFYNAFIYAMMHDYSDSMWIGAYADTAHEEHEMRTWRWVDTAISFIYTNWNDGEPNNSQNMEYCGTILRQNGRWNDDVCEDEKPSICSTRKSHKYDSSGIPNPKNCDLGKNKKYSYTSMLLRKV